MKKTMRKYHTEMGDLLVENSFECLVCFVELGFLHETITNFVHSIQSFLIVFTKDVSFFLDQLLEHSQSFVEFQLFDETTSDATENKLSFRIIQMNFCILPDENI